MILDPTRKNNTLGLVLVNNESIVNYYLPQTNSDLSDHNTIIMGMFIYPGKPTKKRPLKNYFE